MPGGDGTGPRQEKKSYGHGEVHGGECRCPNCGHRELHTLGIPCNTKRCPKCGSLMTRAW